MTNLSDLFPTNASPIKSIQSGFVASGTLSSGSGEDAKYIDVTISAVTTSKCAVQFDGGFGGSASAGAYFVSTGTSAVTIIASARLTSPTNLRISTSSSNSNITNLAGRWQVVEYN